MDPNEVKRRHTSTQFVDWCVFFKEEINDFHREDFFWAQIVEAIVRSNTAKEDQDKIEPEKFLIKFKEKPPEDTPEEAQAKAEARMQASKNAWGALLGLKID